MFALLETLNCTEIHIKPDQLAIFFTKNNNDLKL